MFCTCMSHSAISHIVYIYLDVCLVNVLIPSASLYDCCVVVEVSKQGVPSGRASLVYHTHQQLHFFQGHGSAKQINTHKKLILMTCYRLFNSPILLYAIGTSGGGVMRACVSLTCCCYLGQQYISFGLGCYHHHHHLGWRTLYKVLSISTPFPPLTHPLTHSLH